MMQIKLEMFESTVNGISKFYTYSHKRRRELACLGELFNEPDIENGFKLRHFVDVKSIRWLDSQKRALSALRRVTLDHLGNGPNCTGGEEAAKAKSFHKNLYSLKCMIWLHFMNDFLAPLATLSRAFESDKLLIYQVPSKIDATF